MLHHNSRYRRFLTRPYFYSVFFISLFFLLIWWNSLPQDFVEHLDVEDQQRTGIGVIKPPIAKPLPMDEKKANIVQLTVFMEAQCPDTTGFIRRQLLPSWSRLGASNRINVSIVPFGKASCTAEEDDFKCECQHGVNECELNQLMNCAIDLLPDPDSHIPLIGCIQGKDSLISAFRSCLTGHSSADWLWKCTIGKRGRRLHAIAGNRTASIGEEFNFVPWVVLDGLRDNDAFYALEENLCKRLNEPKPHPCSKFS